MASRRRPAALVAALRFLLLGGYIWDWLLALGLIVFNFTGLRGGGSGGAAHACAPTSLLRFRLPAQCQATLCRRWSVSTSRATRRSATPRHPPF